jgi:anthranilate phosphoribosyltransferase
MPMTPQEALQRTIEHREIFHDEMLHLMRMIMKGEVSPVLMAALITGLRVKKETIGEITAAAQVMREFSTKVHVADKTHLVDIVGTGGDGSHTFNISTCSMFVAAAAGAKVSKHGGRSVSSKSGSADVLESLGVNINLSPEAIARCIDEVGIGFMFAPNHHPAMKNVAPVRRELGIKTIFNILGPLTNPASAPNILMGFSTPIWSAFRSARCSAWALSMPWWCMGATVWTRSAWAPPRWWANCAMARSRNMKSIRKISASRWPATAP